MSAWGSHKTKHREAFKIVEKLPTVPTDILEWIAEVRPKAEGKNRIIMPHWRDIYNDNFSNKFILGGRQIFKSTYTTDVLAFEATSKKNVQLVYVTYDDVNKTAFSRQKLQIGTFDGSEILKLFPRNRLGNVGEISLKNNSTIYITTDHGQYHHVEGKSASHIMLDEAQYQEMQNFHRIPLVMTITQGKLTILGVGGEAGSAYEHLWLQTDRREWVFDRNDDYVDSAGVIFKGQGWRHDLIFGEIKDENTERIKWGLIADKNLMKVMSGRWKSTVPENSNAWHGYHMPQSLIPHIPLSIADALNPKMYNHDTKDFAIESKRQTMSPHLFTSHVNGGFFHAERRPITREMVENLFRGNEDLRLLQPWEIADIKDMFGKQVKITMGVDFGSGSPSQTVICILIKWILQEETREKDEISRIQLVHLDPRPAENLLDQAKNIAILFQEAKCDVGVGDLGYGAIQVQQIQDGGTDRNTGQRFDGVGNNKFYGCRTIGNEVRQLQEFHTKFDEHGESREQLRIDKTTAIQQFIDLMTIVVSDPQNPFDIDKRKTKLMFPANPYSKQKIDFLFSDLTDLTRKDLSEKFDEQTDDPRQYARKEFNHPRDSLMALIYSLKAQDIHPYWNYTSI